MEEAGERAARGQQRMDFFPHSFVVGAKQRRPARLEKVYIAVAVNIGEPGPVGRGHGQRKGIVESKVMLYAAGNGSLRLLRQKPGLVAFLLEILQDGLHVLTADGADWLLDTRRETRVDIVRIGPFRDAIRGLRRLVVEHGLGGA